jgi:hypothetical protein
VDRGVEWTTSIAPPLLAVATSWFAGEARLFTARNITLRHPRNATVLVDTRFSFSVTSAAALNMWCRLVGDIVMPFEDDGRLLLTNRFVYRFGLTPRDVGSFRIECVAATGGHKQEVGDLGHYNAMVMPVALTALHVRAGRGDVAVAAFSDAFFSRVASLPHCVAQTVRQAVASQLWAGRYMNATKLVEAGRQWARRGPGRTLTSNFMLDETDGHLDEFIFVPFDCRLRTFGKMETAACLRSKRVFMFGDSRMRTQFYDIVSFVDMAILSNATKSHGHLDWYGQSGAQLHYQYDKCWVDFHKSTRKWSGNESNLDTMREQLAALGLCTPNATSASSADEQPAVVVLATGLCEIAFGDVEDQHVRYQRFFDFLESTCADDVELVFKTSEPTKLAATAAQRVPDRRRHRTVIPRQRSGSHMERNIFINRMAVDMLSMRSRAWQLFDVFALLVHRTDTMADEMHFWKRKYVGSGVSRQSSMALLNHICPPPTRRRGGEMDYGLKA